MPNKKKPAQKPVKKSAKAPGKKIVAKPAKKVPAKKVKRKLNPLMKLVQQDAAHAEIFGSKPLSRSQMAKKLWDYIKKRKLQHSKKGSMIIATPALKALFGGKTRLSSISDMINLNFTYDKKPAQKSVKKVVSKPANQLPAMRLMPSLPLIKLQPDPALAVIIGTKPLPRSQIMRKLWIYIKKTSLQDSKKWSMINATPALKALFGVKTQVSMFEMTKLVSAYNK